MVTRDPSKIELGVRFPHPALDPDPHLGNLSVSQHCAPRNPSSTGSSVCAAASGLAQHIRKNRPRRFFLKAESSQLTAI